jgi:3-oxoacyl-[acyl-carrier protein] reductase
MFRLDGKIALVTGAARGLGAGIALALARAGARAVVVNDLGDSADSRRTCDAIRATGVQALFIAADVRDEHAVEAMFRAIDEAFHRIDILVSNAGVVRREDIFETTLEGWREVVDTHLTGFFLCARAAMVRMREQRSGRIVVNSSVTAFRGSVRGFVHYSAAKSGQIGMVRTLARTAAPFGVTVNAVAPGVIETAMLRTAHGEEGIREIAKEIPLGLGEIDDVAAAVVFLASDEAKHITGATIDVNGGFYFR